MLVYVGLLQGEKKMKYQNLFIDCELPAPLSDDKIKYCMKEIEKGNNQIKK